MENIVITIEDGLARFLVNEHTEPFLQEGALIRRASHVEPSNPALRWAFHRLRAGFGDTGRVASFTRIWPCLWRINLSPSSGHILPGRWRDRKQAIAAEIKWLNTFFI